ncbi:hypothetical protein [Brevibacillus sp. H7]|uniref:hypothetical protein n=1 Tax=Brevibacillus sp. H7 TaxID=3349138 RepID=UPI0037F2DA6D
MSENKKHEMPDFAQLNDRIIAEPPAGPLIGIRTNLDKPADQMDTKSRQNAGG